MIAPFERILVPVDMTERSRAVVEYAAALAEEFEASMDVLFVWELSDYVTGGWSVDTAGPMLGALAHDGAAGHLDEFLSSIDLGGLRVRARLACGNVSDTIVEIAEDEGYDLIVVGNRQRPRLLSASVADKVARSAPCPVLTVRATGAEA